MLPFRENKKKLRNCEGKPTGAQDEFITLTQIKKNQHTRARAHKYENKLKIHCFFSLFVLFRIYSASSKLREISLHLNISRFVAQWYDGPPFEYKFSIFNLFIEAAKID